LVLPEVVPAARVKLAGINGEDVAEIGLLLLVVIGYSVLALDVVKFTRAFFDKKSAGITEVDGDELGSDFRSYQIGLVGITSRKVAFGFDNIQGSDDFIDAVLKVDFECNGIDHEFRLPDEMIDVK
jgi:hypothetical protein